MEASEIEAEFEQVVSAREGRIVHGLEGISHAVLRVVEFVSERGETRNRDEAQAEVPRVRGEFGKPDPTVDARAGILVKNSGSHATESEARFVHEV